MHAFSIKTLSMFGRLSVDGRSKCIRNEVFCSRRDCDNRRLPYRGLCRLCCKAHLCNPCLVVRIFASSGQPSCLAGLTEFVNATKNNNGQVNMISARVRTWRRHYLISCQSIPGGNSGHRSGILSLFKEREVLIKRN